MSTTGSEAGFQAATDDFEVILERARRGSGRALRYLYDSLSPQLAGYLRVRGAADVGTATNEVFHRAFDRLDRFKGGESGFRSWVFTIANNLLIDEHRKRIRRPNVVASLDPVRHDVAGGDTESEAIRNLSAGDIDRLLETLTPNQRDVLHLRIIAGLTLAETAEVLQRPLGAVKSLQHRAVEALRNHLERNRVSPDAIGTF
jgi:RNA polymerase sigma-70 factor (ECF subfamily)